MRVNARDEEYEYVELFGKPALFTNSPIDRSTVPEGWYAYDLRGSDYDPVEPMTVESIVAVNHAGTILIHEPVSIPKEGFRRLKGQLDFLEDHLTLADFCEVRWSVLKSLSDMEGYCRTHGGEISGGWQQNYGYIVETEHCRYCLRCNPQPGDHQACVTKGEVSTVYLAIAHNGETHLDESRRDNPRFAADSTIQGTVERLKPSIRRHRPNGIGVFCPARSGGEGETVPSCMFSFRFRACFLLV